MCPLCSILFTEDQFQTQISTVDLDLMSNKSSVSIGDRRKRCAFLKKYLAYSKLENEDTFMIKCFQITLIVHNVVA